MALGRADRTGNVITFNSKANYDALEENPYTGLLAAPAGLNFDGIGVPDMEDFPSPAQLKAAKAAVHSGLVDPQSKLNFEFMIWFHRGNN